MPYPCTLLHLYVPFSPIRQNTGLSWCSQSTSSPLAPPLDTLHFASLLWIPLLEISATMWKEVSCCTLHLNCLVWVFVSMMIHSVSKALSTKNPINLAPWILLACKCDYLEHHHVQEDFWFGTGGCATIYQPGGKRHEELQCSSNTSRKKKKKQACLRYPHNLDFVTELLSIIAYIATIYTKFFQFWTGLTIWEN